MDEKYADELAPAHAQVTSLTGILVPAAAHRDFRQRFYRLVVDASGSTDRVVQPVPVVHASCLLPDRDDNDRFRFLENLVDLVIQLGFRIYRVGYYKDPEILSLAGMKKHGLLGLCFSGMLHCLKDELSDSEIWPVMETDGSKDQDRAFAGSIQWLDYLTAQPRPMPLSINNDNLGELLYSTKRSAHGSTVDCVGYLLHQKFLNSIGFPQSTFKRRLAEIASGLNDAIAFDEVIKLKIGRPPAGYRAEGPYRYAVPIAKKD